MNKITVVCHKDHSHGYEDFEGKCLLCVVDDLMLEIGNLMIQKRRAEKREWGLITDDALIEEVRRRGFTIRDAQISPKIKDEYELCCQKYDTCTEPCTPRGRHLAKREWVGLTEQDVHDAFQFTELIKHLSFDRERPEWCENFAAYLEAKLKEKNGG